MHGAIQKVFGAILACGFVFSLDGVPAYAQNLTTESFTAPNLTASSLLRELTHIAPDISPQILGLALRAATCAKTRVHTRSPYLAVIDYSLPSSRKRFWLFDLARKRLMREELVAHGKESGVDRPTRFSNEPGSLQSSIGLFATGGTYMGQHGYSMYLYGLERGFNDRAFDRAIVMHGASYVSEDFIDRWQRLGRSWGCPALPVDAAPRVIDYLKDGALLFSYYPDQQWLQHSEFLNGCEG